MQYFEAVQKGKHRATRSQIKMFKVAGFGMLTLTTKKIDGKFEPVGEEEFAAVIAVDDGFVALIVDADGFTKAQSKSMPKDDAMNIFDQLCKSGMAQYTRDRIQIWSETRPTVHL